MTSPADIEHRLRDAISEYDRAVELHSYVPHHVDREAEQHRKAAAAIMVAREAADTIAQLVKENLTLRNAGVNLLSRAEAAEAETATLREALERAELSP
jgi:hypothetical protein